jgi:hypothetical protein
MASAAVAGVPFPDPAVVRLCSFLQSRTLSYRPKDMKHLSSLAKVLMEHYGSNLGSMALRLHNGSTHHSLYRLLHRQKRLFALKICSMPDNFLPSLTASIVHGHFQHLQELDLHGLPTSVTLAGALVPSNMLSLLGDVIQWGFLPSLEELTVSDHCEDGGLLPLLRALREGGSPRLRRLLICLAAHKVSDYKGVRKILPMPCLQGQADNILRALTEALEHRQRLGTCRGLEFVDVIGQKVIRMPDDVRLGLLRVVMGSTKIAPSYRGSWGQEEARILKKVGAPHLTTLRAHQVHIPLLEALSSMISLEELIFNGGINSDCVEAFEALMKHHRENLLPKLMKLELKGAFETSDGIGRFFEAVGQTSAFGSVKELILEEVNQAQCAGFAQGFSAAVSEGAFPQLKKLDLVGVAMGDAGLIVLCDGLKESLCAKRLEDICIRDFNFLAVGFNALCGLIEEGHLPVLSSLQVYWNDQLGDDGMAQLMTSLAAPGSNSSKITKLFLSFGLTDAGLNILSTNLQEDHVLPNLMFLDLSGNEAVADVGAQHLSRAITAGCLPNLVELDVYDTDIQEVGEQALKDAIQKHCPKFQEYSP